MSWDSDLLPLFLDIQNRELMRCVNPLSIMFPWAEIFYSPSTKFNHAAAPPLVKTILLGDREITFFHNIAISIKS